MGGGWSGGLFGLNSAHSFTDHLLQTNTALHCRLPPAADGLAYFVRLNTPTVVIVIVNVVVNVVVVVVVVLCARVVVEVDVDVVSSFIHTHFKRCAPPPPYGLVGPLEHTDCRHRRRCRARASLSRSTSSSSFINAATPTAAVVIALEQWLAVCGRSRGRWWWCGGGVGAAEIFRKCGMLVAG